MQRLLESCIVKQVVKKWKILSLAQEANLPEGEVRSESNEVRKTKISVLNIANKIKRNSSFSSDIKTEKGKQKWILSLVKTGMRLNKFIVA